MELEILNRDGTSTGIWIHKFELTDVFMGHKNISADIDMASPATFLPGTYVVYNGEKFSIETFHSTKKEGELRYTVSLIFYGLTYELERCLMRDLVPYDNSVVYPTPMMIEFTGKINYLTERIQACLDEFYGKNAWTINIASRGEDVERNISLQNVSCWQALTLAYNEYGLYFYANGRVITITDTVQNKINYAFRVGPQGGLYSVEESPKSDVAIITKLRVYGGERNLDFSYPKLPDYTGSVLQPDFILTPLRLMLPDFKKDGKTDYLMADPTMVSKYGVREGVAIFDDIYPSIIGMTNSSGQRIDQIAGLDINNTGQKNTFILATRNMDFRKPDGTFMAFDDLITNKAASVVIKTGQLQGYSFKIIRGTDSWNTNSAGTIIGWSYQFVCEKIKLSDSAEEIYIPNDNFKMAVGDEFVLINIQMPISYVLSAENRLKDRGLKHLGNVSVPQNTYSASISEKFVETNNLEIHAGYEMNIADFGEDVLVQSMVIREGESSLPKYELILNNEPSPDVIQTMQAQISSLEAKSQNDFSSTVDINEQYRNKLDKAVWDEALEIKTDSAGVKYLWGKLPFVGSSSITAYSGSSPAVPNIWQSIPLDGNTLTWTDGKLTVVGGPGGGGAATIYIGGTAYESVDGVVRLPAYPSPVSITVNGLNFQALNGVITLPNYPAQPSVSVNGSTYNPSGNVITLPNLAESVWVGQTRYIVSEGKIALPEYPSPPDLSPYATLGTEQTFTATKWWGGNFRITSSGLLDFISHSTSWARGLFFWNKEGTSQRASINMYDNGTHGEAIEFQITLAGTQFWRASAIEGKVYNTYEFWENNPSGLVIHTPNVYYSRLKATSNGIEMRNPSNDIFESVLSVPRMGIGAAGALANLHLRGDFIWESMPEGSYDYTFTDTIIRDSVTAKTKRVNNGIIPAKYNQQILNRVDLSGLDENLYYPVIIPAPTYSITTIELKNALNENKPSWATHSAGFSIGLVIQVRGSGWGTIPDECKALFYSESFANKRILGRVSQLGNYSNIIIHLRGGGIYRFGGNYQPEFLINPRGEWSDPSGNKAYVETEAAQPQDPLYYANYVFSAGNIRIDGTFTAKNTIYAKAGISVIGNVTANGITSSGNIDAVGSIIAIGNLQTNSQLHVAQQTYLNSTLNVSGVVAFNSYMIVNGDIWTEYSLYAKGNVIAYSTSDKRLKNIRVRPKFVDKFLSLGPVEEYTFTDEAKRLRTNTDDKVHYGLLYQNVKESSAPGAAFEMEDGYGSVNYLSSDILCLMAGALRECIEEIKTLKKENK